jgi:sterol desaturase/sphingolipid hydroxylase (fatty acid hydroxylase superfamily)
MVYLIKIHKLSLAEIKTVMGAGLQINWVVATYGCLQFVAWGFLSILIAEVIRDSYHAACHHVQWLSKWHNKHHQVYKRDLSIVSLEAYKDSQLYHDIVESILLLIIIGAIAIVFQPVGLWLGVLYAATFLYGASLRYFLGKIETDYNHKPGALSVIPSTWWVNRTYHWRHHFDDVNAYYSGVFPIVDKILGTALSLKGKTVAITGASGTLGQALTTQLIANNAKVIALTTNPENIVPQPRLTALSWESGKEEELRSRLQKVDILIINHGINVHGSRTSSDIDKSFEVNTFSAVRLMDVFFSTVTGANDKATKEIWINTSEAEVSPALSPLYELSKRTLGNIITLKRLDSPCTIRKLILGPFKSQLNPYGVMSARQVAKGIVFFARRDFRNIIVTVNPLTYIFFPIKELSTWLYFVVFSK